MLCAIPACYCSHFVIDFFQLILNDIWSPWTVNFDRATAIKYMEKNTIFFKEAMKNT